jgi:hypothetical protein
MKQNYWQRNRHLYPDDWHEIRASILKRAENRCEFCGVENRAKGWRDRFGEFHQLRELATASVRDLRLMTGKRIIAIVLTVAHLDHDPANCDPDNLKALCQMCHLNYDLKHHKRNASHTRAVKRAGPTMPLL